MIRTNKLYIAAAASVLLIGGYTGSAVAQSYDATHPRPAEVNRRLNDQQNRVDNKVSGDKMSTREAEHIQRQDKGISNEEHAMERQDNGHLTNKDDRTLNRQENHVSNEIKDH